MGDLLPRERGGWDGKIPGKRGYAGPQLNGVRDEAGTAAFSLSWDLQTSEEGQKISAHHPDRLQAVSTDTQTLSLVHYVQK